LAARGIAGSAFTEGTVSSGGGTGTVEDGKKGPTKYNVGRTVDRVHITLEKGLVAKQWVEAVDGNNQAVRDRIKKGAAE
jgi:hypothetical protein